MIERKRHNRIGARGTRLVALAAAVASGFASVAMLSEVAGAQDGFQRTASWLLQSIPDAAPTDGSSMAAQMYAQSLPAVGRPDLWLEYPHRVRLPGTCRPVDPPPASLAAHIAALAESTRIVIVNEAHDVPWHRQLTESLLAPLWKQGYRYFAAETFSDSADDYPNEPFARLDAGSYSIEPAYGELIRTAKRLGFRLVSYESGPAPPGLGDSNAARVDFREETQAANLVSRIFEADADARLVIHVGYSHAAEVPIPSFEGTQMPWMAARLKAKTGIDPLTIDQTYCRSASGRLELAEPSASMPAGTFDLAIAYPEVTTTNGRADWRLVAGRRLVDLPDNVAPPAERVIVEARRVDEPDTAVPVDRVLIRPGERVPLLLPPGRFRVSVTMDADLDRQAVAEPDVFELEVGMTQPSASR